jgi:hypothetical protein
MQSWKARCVPLRLKQRDWEAGFRSAEGEICRSKYGHKFGMDSGSDAVAGNGNTVRLLALKSLLALIKIKKII